MATVAPPPDPEADARVQAVFDDIRATRGSDFINNVWRYLAFDPPLLEEVWRDVKAVLATPSLIDAKTKEMIYAAVSIANNCDYCTHSHLASARAKGMTGAEQAELLRIVATAAKTNALLNAIRPPIDAAFLAEGPGDAVTEAEAEAPAGAGAAERAGAQPALRGGTQAGSRP